MPNTHKFPRVEFWAGIGVSILTFIGSALVTYGRIDAKLSAHDKAMTEVSSLKTQVATLQEAMAWVKKDKGFAMNSGDSTEPAPAGGTAGSGPVEPTSKHIPAAGDAPPWLNPKKDKIATNPLEDLIRGRQP